MRCFEKPARGLGLEEKSLTSCPALERFLKTIAHLMSFVKIQLTQARLAELSAQSFALASSFDTPTT